MRTGIGFIAFERLLSALVLAFIACALVGGAWHILERPVTPPDWDGQVSGLTYSGYRPGQGPAQHRYPSPDEIAQDMALLAPHTHRIRTYTSTEGPDVPALAARYGLDVMAGAWLGKDKAANERELKGLIRQARGYPNVSRLIVGNEVMLREEMTEAELIAAVDRVRRHTRQPVSVADTWGIWLEHPKLAAHVDFIAIHILPYWEGVAIEDAAAYTLKQLQLLRTAYPKKPIVITETGWPSRGHVENEAHPTPQAQARYLREFLPQARALGIDYYVIEAFDGQWKRDEEGRPGPYWGLFDAFREWKIPLTGPLWVDQGWQDRVAPALVVALALGTLWNWVFAHWRWWARLLAVLAMAAGASFVVWRDMADAGSYAPIQSAFIDLVLHGLLGVSLLVFAVQLIEALDVLGTRRWRRAFGVSPWPAEQPLPLVSLHVAICNEPPEMVIATLESLERLDWPALEVLVVDNNTHDDRLWRPVEAWIAERPQRFRFWSLPVCEGFKAGALNFALSHTDPRAEVLGVIDADYRVELNWLRELVGHFTEPQVAVVQAPQAHREFESDLLARSANWEFEGFFRAGMHHRNERNAIIQHGTMCLVRAAALREAGGWAQWTICEDAELGLRLMTRGWELRYVDRVYGRGLTPEHFAALRSQRRRWALGAMQILKGHAGALFARSPLSWGQRYHFIAGWLPWLQEALQVAVMLMCVGWTAGMLIAPRYVEPPIPGTLALMLAIVLARAAIGAAVYATRVRCTWRESFEAAIAAMALNYAVACGIWAGLLGRHARFIVTAKAGSRSGRQPLPPETKWAVALLAAAVATLVQNGFGGREPLCWAAALVVMALPHCAALWLSRASRPGRPSIQPVPASGVDAVPGLTSPA
ncbi:MAG TPA: glycosyltransferase [Aromatoleum sp.]|uniref:glycosyltransferase family 2 protein n=1 Tax=Aromatoleum sp. TaxID=2307007 RepID=UPI002B46DC51|nr:glycosyltransferase [Aromatoleum sp.]HJV24352.1 glycosyltransferase [Aromatoleum sp.]